MDMSNVFSVILNILGIGVPTLIFGALQVFLAGRKNKWIGLILPLVSLLLVGSVMMFIATDVFKVPAYEVTFGDDSLENRKIDIGVMIDENGQVTNFGPLRVKDRETNKTELYPLKFDEAGELLGGKDALKYKSIIDIVTAGEEGFSGDSLSESAMKKLYFKDHFSQYVKAALMFALWFIPTIVCFIIYIVMRRKVKKSQAKQGLERMVIEDL